jgi:NAD(P)-dependent dehydrogenase (short-subunit alcohol dehydrogenase family)
MAVDSGGRLRVLQLDVADPRSVRAFAEEVRGGEPPDVLLNNAAVFGKIQPLDELDTEDMVATFSTNVAGPLRLSSALLPVLRRGSARRIIHLSSVLGSISSHTEGSGPFSTCYAIRTSKAALNMAMRTMALELAPEGFTTVSIHPGWVQTDMGGPLAPMRPEDSIRAMLGVIDGLRPEHNGRFFDFQGQELPW